MSDDPMKIHWLIKGELYRACEKLGAGRDLLSIIGSYGDTLEPDEILSMLQEWNAGRLTIYPPYLTGNA